VAVDPSQRPKRFIVADAVKGPVTVNRSWTVPVDPQPLDDALEALRLLGINTVGVEQFGTQGRRVEQRARELGFTGFRHAVVSPKGGVFPWREKVRPAEVEKWAAGQAMLVGTRWGMPPAKVRLFHIADEVAWYFPEVLRELRASPAGLRMFRAYLRRHRFGPGDLGAGSWTAVVPIGQSQATTLPRRRLFYWTVRFVADSASDQLRRDTQALRRHFSPGLQTTTNWNNRVSVSYYRAPRQRIARNPVVGPDTAVGSMHWPDTGRASAVTTMWTEDWFKDRDAQMWGPYADGLRAAARPGGPFGGYVVGRTLGDVPGGGKYKALTLIGHGAKIIEWYTFGPEERFADNGYSNHVAAYREIADANRLIAKSEDLLYPGRTPQPRVALLLPRSAQLWHRTRQTWQGDDKWPLFESEMYGLHFALTHAHYQVDFVDEQAVAAGTLRSKGYRVLYVTAPNVALAAQRRIREWVQQGGVAAFAPGAASADEYNTPTGVLASLRGGGVRRPALRLLGRGRSVSYGFWPGNQYYQSANRVFPGRLRAGWSADKRRVVLIPARLGRVVQPATADVEMVEVDRLDSRAGTAVVLLNWTGQPIPSLTVRLEGAGTMRSAQSVESGTVSVQRSGNDAVVRLPLRDVDVLKLRR
jgi:hypothetical protein